MNRNAPRRAAQGRPEPLEASAAECLRAVVYARYSSDRQRDASIDDQVRLCKARIEREGWTMAQVFRDAAISGASAFRPGYQALLVGARNAAFDVVVAEALDRLSRDQEDTAALYKRLKFAGIRLVTLSEGEISELHVGLKGTMSALFLKDLADKTRRGLRGRVEAGRSGGGNAYGYRVVRRLDGNGSPVTGERVIDPAEAEVVRRIFRRYAAGDSPRRIALELNADRVPGPGGKTEPGRGWGPSTLNGNRARGTGILNNELYIGRLCWNRLQYMKDPDTGKRRSRPRAEDDIVVTEVPDLRIIDQALWDAVKERQAALDQRDPEGPANGDVQKAPFWLQQRPRHLFSGLMRCGVCGGGFSKVSQNHFGCSTARNKGPTACTNVRTIRRVTLETTVLDALRERLMDPARFKAFVAAFTAEWNSQQSDIAAEQEAQATEERRVRQQIDRLVDAIADGTPVAAVRDRLNKLEQKRLALEAGKAAASAPAPRLMPDLAEIYRETVANLVEALGHEDTASAREQLRSLVETVTLYPDGKSQRVEVRGELAAILGLTASARGRSAAEPAMLAEQVKMVAGTGFEPVTFRL